MKITKYSRALLNLCRKMRLYNWKLKDDAIRLSSLEEHCPLSYCGGTRNISWYKTGGYDLGFSESQILEISNAVDSSKWVIKYYIRLRRILVKAAKL